MKPLTFLLALAVPFLACAHDHLEVGAGGGQLAVAGNLDQRATRFPVGETPSNYLTVFPGGYYACEFTFKSDGDLLSLPSPGLVRAEILSVAGPAGGEFGFWEPNATTPTIARASGWTASSGDTPSFAVSEDGTGYGHIHGRVFTMTKPGVYEVTFRAVDAAGGFAPSAPFVVTFTAVEPPQLAAQVAGGMVTVSFASRDLATYWLQTSETLAPGSWVTVGTLDGDGGTVEFSEPLAGRSRVFYRLVELP
jgi:hypothetical protein